MLNNIYDLEEIHKHVEETFPRIRSDPTTTLHPAKMNIIVPIIPESVRDIMDFVFLVTGVNLNVLLSLVILLNPSTRTSTNCYLMSLVCSNLAILLEPFKLLLRSVFDIKLHMNVDYIFLVTFGASSLTIILLNVEAYLSVCQKNLPLLALFRAILKTSTAVKSVLFVWILCITMTAIELDMFDRFADEVTYDICVASTVMFLIFPCFIFLMLDCFILYDLMISRWLNENRNEDIERYLLLVGVTVAFCLTMIPYRFVKAVALVTSFCCNDITIDIIYTMVKVCPTILPIICFMTTSEFRRGLERMLLYKRAPIAKSNEIPTIA